MGIYRGPGGTGDAVNDASSEAVITIQAKDAALVAQAAAETSATNASTSASNASTSATSASSSASSATTSASNASTSATNASSSASSASTSASTATTQAGIATTKASEASTSATNAASSASSASTSASTATTQATNASNSATSAASSATAAAASYDNFDDRYLGPKSSNPTVDNDGNALLTGALYFNTVSPEMRVYTGSGWSFIGSGGGAGVESFNSRTGAVTLTSSDVTTALTYTPLSSSAIGSTVQAYDAQLADVAGLTPADNSFIVGNGTNFVAEDAATARTSLGLGTAATTASTAYATAAQGTTADTAYADRLKWDGSAAGLTAATGRTSLGLGTAATTAATDYATAAQGTKADNALPAANPSYTGTLTGGTGVVNLGSGQVYKDASGNVGIGTSSPSNILDVKGAAPVIKVSPITTLTQASAFLAQNTGGNVYFGRENSTGTYYGYDPYAGFIKSEGNYPFAIGVNGSQRMSITPSGGVAFGSSGTAYGSSGQILQSNGNAAPTWVSVPNSATVTSSATDVTLTASSNQVQQITMTAFGKNVILPDATTFTTTGGPKFIIENSGAIAFDVAATGSGRMFGVAPGQTVEISLSSISTASGGWVATPTTAGVGNPFSTSSNTSLLSYTPAAINSTNSVTSFGTYYSAMSCVALSTTSVLVAWIAPTTGYVTGVIGTISGTTITWGTPTTINSARAYVSTMVTAISSTTAMVAMTVSGGGHYAIGLAISGTTITPSTISAVGTSGTVQALITVGSTVVAVSTGAGGGNFGIKVWNYNGASAPTFGTVVTFGTNSAATVNYSAQMIPLTATTLLCTYYDTGASVTYARVFSVSGSTITAGAAAVALTATLRYTGSLVFISATEGLLVSEGSWQKITVSGTTATASSWGSWNIWNQTNSSTVGYYFGVTSQLVGSTDFIGINQYVQAGITAITRYSYNSTLGSFTQKGYTSCSNSPTAWAVCSVSSTQALVAGLTSQSDGNYNWYPAGYIVALNG